MQVTPQNPHPTNPKPENKVRVKVWPTTTATTIILQKQRKKEDTIIPLIYHLYLFHSLSFPIQNHGNSTLTLTLSLSIVLSHQWPSWTKIYVEENQKGKKKKKKRSLALGCLQLSLSLSMLLPEIPFLQALQKSHLHRHCFSKLEYIFFFFFPTELLWESLLVSFVSSKFHTQNRKSHIFPLYIASSSSLSFWVFSSPLP